MHVTMGSLIRVCFAALPLLSAGCTVNLWVPRVVLFDGKGKLPRLQKLDYSEIREKQEAGEQFTGLYDPETLEHLPDEDFDRLVRDHLALADTAVTKKHTDLAKRLYFVLMKRANDEAFRSAAIRGYGRTATPGYMIDITNLLYQCEGSTPAEQEAIIDALVDAADWDVDTLRNFVLTSLHSQHGTWTSSTGQNVILIRAMARANLDATLSRMHEYVSRAEPEIRLLALEMIAAHPTGPHHSDHYLMGILNTSNPEGYSPREMELALQAYLDLTDAIARDDSRITGSVTRHWTDAQGQSHEHRLSRAEQAADRYEDVLRVKDLDPQTRLRVIQSLGQVSDSYDGLRALHQDAHEGALRTEAQLATIAIALRLIEQGKFQEYDEPGPCGPGMKVIDVLNEVAQNAATPEIAAEAERALDGLRLPGNI